MYNIVSISIYDTSHLIKHQGVFIISKNNCSHSAWFAPPSLSHTIQNKCTLSSQVPVLVLTYSFSQFMIEVILIHSCT